MPLAIGDYVHLRPSLFQIPAGIAPSLAGQTPVWQIDSRVLGVDLETVVGYSVRYVWPVTLCGPAFRDAGLDDVIRCDPPKAPPSAPRDPLTGLTAAEADLLYRTRLDQAGRGELLAPPVGWDAARLVFHTPYGSVTLHTVQYWEGYTLDAIPEHLRRPLQWAADFCRR